MERKELEIINHNSIMIKTSADAFYETYKMCMTNSVKQEFEVSISIPAIVNISIAIELYLKYIMSINRLKYKATHNLEILYNSLPLSVKCQTNLKTLIK